MQLVAKRIVINIVDGNDWSSKYVLETTTDRKKIKKVVSIA